MSATHHDKAPKHADHQQTDRSSVATVAIDDDLRHQLKVRAALEKRSLKSLLESIVSQYLRDQRAA